MSLRVLIVDDSATARAALRHALESDSDIRVVGELSGGANIISELRTLRPDLVTMDVFMGSENGLSIASLIMEQEPRPVLVVTASDPKNPQLVYRTLEAGALDVIAKLPGPRHDQYAERRRRLLRLVRTLAGVPVVRRRRQHREPRPTPATGASGTPVTPGAGVIVIGASTGGPPVLAEILRGLPAPFGVPLAIAQHIMNGFSDGHANWLAEATGHKTRVVHTPSPLEPGTVYLAPDDKHLLFTSPYRVEASASAAQSQHRPSVDVLFESAAEHFGERAIAALLTGMGKDGAAGMRVLFEVGATTLIQEPKSCVVDSMPRAAEKLGAVKHSLSPSEIAGYLGRVVTRPRAR